MTTNETRRSVMQMAWSFLREARIAGKGRSFGDCLRGAWRWIKDMAAYATKFMQRARRAGGRVQFTSLIRSPIARATGAGSQRDFQAAYLTACIGN
jgi:hypothetical protein